MKSQIPYQELQVSIKNHVTIEIMPGFAEFHNNRKYFLSQEEQSHLPCRTNDSTRGFKKLLTSLTCSFDFYLYIQ